MNKHPNTAVVLVAASVASVGVIHERDIHKPLPLTPLPLCDEVGEALHTMPPMTLAPAPETSEIAPAVAENAPETREIAPEPAPAVTPEIAPARTPAKLRRHVHRPQHVSKEVPQPVAAPGDDRNLWERLVDFVKKLCGGAP